MTRIAAEVARRRTFAIISHPDAGKTTLTEKLLLFGGAIQLAGAVKARGEARRARSDWMKVEQERGISVTASVMTFDYRGCTFNLLDTPGHQDFSEDTYRTLTAVDSAVMVIDAARGIEAQTRKLFEVCRLRDVPIATFVNKLDREGRDPFEVIDEIERDLQLDVTPATWPIGAGRSFLGCYDLLGSGLVLFDRGQGARVAERERMSGLDDPRLAKLLPRHALEQLREESALAAGGYPAFDLAAYRAGQMTPVFFGSALHNFGVRELLDALVDLAPSPRPAPTRERTVEPEEEKVSGFVFKIQANMDPKHRDRIAFVRLCSGRFARGMKLWHVRAGRDFAVHTPVLFLARERELAEEAFAGDILGIPNHGLLRIGDTLTEGEVLRFTGIPSFAPELLQRVRPVDPMRAKHLGRALLQLAEEGAAQVFRPRVGNEWIVGVAGPLQFDVLADRIRTEYDLEARFEATSLHTARWVEADDEAELKRFLAAYGPHLADDVHGDPVYLAPSAWRMKAAEEDWPRIRFRTTKEHLQ
ncbi:MAG: peptide chain release factor 3 [Thermoanaerobaculia bacterium]|nr:peptide chain release factor 3 [Thermoanaerobaculia bacterium]